MTRRGPAGLRLLGAWLLAVGCSSGGPSDGVDDTAAAQDPTVPGGGGTTTGPGGSDTDPDPPGGTDTAPPTGTGTGTPTGTGTGTLTGTAVDVVDCDDLPAVVRGRPGDVHAVCLYVDATTCVVQIDDAAVGLTCAYYPSLLNFEWKNEPPQERRQVELWAWTAESWSHGTLEPAQGFGPDTLIVTDLAFGVPFSFVATDDPSGTRWEVEVAFHEETLEVLAVTQP